MREPRVPGLLAGLTLLFAGALAQRPSRAAAEDDGTRRALLVGISHYSGYDPGWVDLASGNDVAAVRSALLRWGFSPANITELADERATRAGLLGALDGLVSSSRPGDHVVFHYSGHGQQIADDSGDEADGYDEALVAWGAPMRPPEGYTGARHVRDDELNTRLDTLRARVGATGSVVIFLDACHSGTATRGGPIHRGGGPPIGVPAALGLAAVVGGDLFTPSVGGPATGRLVVLSGARADQVAQEAVGPDGTHTGAFTAALVSALSSEQRMPSWSAVYERVRATMARTVISQTPQIEGDRDSAVFDDHDERPDTYFSVTKVSTTHRIQLDAGQLHGLNPGSLVTVQRSGAPRPTPETTLAAGAVVQVTATTAVVETKEAVAVDDLASARVFVTKWDLGDQRLRVKVDLGEAELNRTWSAAVAGSPREIVVGTAPDVILRRGANRLLLVDGTDTTQTLAEAPVTGPDGAPGIVARLADESLSRLVRAVDLKAERYRIEARLLPSISGQDGGCRPATSTFDHGGALEIHPGDAFQIEVRNVGVTDAWLALALIDALGHPSQLLPQPGLSPERLPAGGSWWRPDLCFQVGPPFGTEELKFFATRNPLDLGPLLGWTTITTREASSDSLQQLINALGGGTRGAAPPPEYQDGFTASIVYTITNREPS